MKMRPLFKKLMNKQTINAQAKPKPGLKQQFKNKRLKLIKTSKAKFNKNRFISKTHNTIKRVSFNKVPQRILNFKKRPIKNRKSFSYYNNRTFQTITLSENFKDYKTTHLFTC
jgi:hypothetical protein